MQLAREVLDKEIVDCDGFKAGKVDDLLLAVHAGEPPIVRAIVTQHGAVARQFGGTITRVSGWLRRRVLGFEPDVAPVEIPWEHVTRIDVTVHLDLDRHHGGLMRSEQAVWDRWISRLPWARR
jgi:sporulation protein YlmC with PRC-barrel domain